LVNNLILPLPNFTLTAADATKTYNLLLSPKTAYIKKRQLMRTTFGDYRAKMEKEDKKFKLGKTYSTLGLLSSIDPKKTNLLDLTFTFKGRMA
jgi:Domain of unknown function (DUF4615)